MASSKLWARIDSTHIPSRSTGLPPAVSARASTLACQVSRNSCACRYLARSTIGSVAPSTFAHPQRASGEPRRAHAEQRLHRGRVVEPEPLAALLLLGLV